MLSKHAIFPTMQWDVIQHAGNVFAMKWEHVFRIRSKSRKTLVIALFLSFRVLLFVVWILHALIFVVCISAYIRLYWR